MTLIASCAPCPYRGVIVLNPRYGTNMFPQSKSSAVAVTRQSARRRDGGFTLIETAVVLVIGGLMIQAMVTGVSLIQTARVNDVMRQQAAIEAAVDAFQDRYRALPGDYADASTALRCGPTACANGDGNGRIDGTNAAGVREDLLAWAHLSAAGLLSGKYEFSGDVTVATWDNSPTNVYGGYVRLATDNAWGAAEHNAARNNLKTGMRVPASVLAAVDGKIDDGLPYSGKFQFAAATQASACLDVSAGNVVWKAVSGGDDCQATTLLN
jgi:prepilin-type N-terminal cleavage/methylation domain-containing protein